MLSLLEIKKATVNKLEPLGVPTIANDIRSGFDKPAFFVQLMPIGDETDISISTNTVTINIHYFSKEKTEIENLKMLDKLKKIFINKLEVEDRVLTLYEKRYDIDDNVLQFKFDIRYTESAYVDPEDEIIYEDGSDFEFGFN